MASPVEPETASGEATVTIASPDWPTTWQGLFCITVGRLAGLGRVCLLCFLCFLCFLCWLGLALVQALRGVLGLVVRIGRLLRPREDAVVGVLAGCP